MVRGIGRRATLRAECAQSARTQREKRHPITCEPHGHTRGPATLSLTQAGARARQTYSSTSSSEEEGRLWSCEAHERDERGCTVLCSVLCACGSALDPKQLERSKSAAALARQRERLAPRFERRLYAGALETCQRNLSTDAEEGADRPRCLDISDVAERDVAVGFDRAVTESAPGEIRCAFRPAVSRRREVTAGWVALHKSARSARTESAQLSFRQRLSGLTS